MLNTQRQENTVGPQGSYKEDKPNIYPLCYCPSQIHPLPSLVCPADFTQRLTLGPESSCLSAFSWAWPNWVTSRKLEGERWERLGLFLPSHDLECAFWRCCSSCNYSFCTITPSPFPELSMLNALIMFFASFAVLFIWVLAIPHFY